MSTRVSFAPTREGDFAGLLAVIDESHFLAFGIEQVDGRRSLAVRKRADAGAPQRGDLMIKVPLPATAAIELKLAFTYGRATLAWRPAGGEPWRTVGREMDVEYMSSVHAGLFTGVLVGPYAVRGES